eukprot:3729947-Pleurochrysis_carterae.AAC.1
MQRWTSTRVAATRQLARESAAPRSPLSTRSRERGTPPPPHPPPLPPLKERLCTALCGSTASRL